MHIFEKAFHAANGLDAAAFILYNIVLILNSVSLSAFGLVIPVILSIGLCTLGALSVIKQRRGLQLTYMIIQIIACVCGTIFAIFSIALLTPSVRDIYEKLETVKLLEKMNQYENNKEEVDSIQKLYKCCGTASYKYANKPEGLPKSCCEDLPCLKPYSQGCEKAKTDEMVGMLRSGLPIILIMIPIKITSIVLIHLIRKRGI